MLPTCSVRLRPIGPLQDGPRRGTAPTDRTDLLGKLQEGKDDEGNPMGREELTAEALTQLIAGSDTTSK